MILQPLDVLGDLGPHGGGEFLAIDDLGRHGASILRKPRRSRFPAPPGHPVAEVLAAALHCSVMSGLNLI